MVGAIHSIVNAYAAKTVAVLASGFTLERTDTTLVVERCLSNDFERFTQSLFRDRIAMLL